MGSARDALEDCDNLQSLSINNAPESTGVTTFVQEACEAVDVLGKHYVSSKLFQKQGDIQDLKEYFRRPRVAFSGSIPPSLRDLATSIDITPANLFGASGIFPNGVVRLTGIHGLRFKIVFTLQVACTPFHQGLLSLNWQYNDSYTSTTSYARCRYSQTSTNIPHVRLDLAESTMAVLEIPFLFNEEYLPISATATPVNWSYGIIALNTILPVDFGAGGINPSVRLMVHLEDLELVGAFPNDTVNLSLQGGRTLGKPAQEFEQDAYPMSSAVNALSRTVGFVAKGVPSLSTLAGPTSWALARTAGAMRSFGWSKPQIQDPVVRTNRLNTVCEHNVDLASPTVMVGPMASNTLSVDPQFAGTDVDEMALPYVLSQWSQICAGKMLGTHTAGTVIYAAPISPCAFWFRSKIGTGAPYCNIPIVTNATSTTNCFQPSNVFFWASMFKRWRGDFEFKFTFAKTKMHGGRVLVTYTPDSSLNTGLGVSPGTVPAPALTATGPQPFGYSAVFDLRDNNTFTFDVPFVSTLPYQGFRSATGSITMVVFDPLQATPTVASNLDFLVEVRAKPNFELSNLGSPLFPAYNNNNAVPLLQSGRIVSSVSEDVSQHVAGERINSVKQMIMYPKRTNFSLTASNGIELVPPLWWYHRPQPYIIPPPATLPPESFSIAGNAATCYRYARGSSDYHLYLDSTRPSIRSSVARFVGNNEALVNNFLNTPNSNSAMVFSNEKSLHVRVPALQKAPRYVTNSHGDGLWGVGNPELVLSSGVAAPDYFPKFNVYNYDTAVAQLYVQRSAGDDAMLGHYMGPPPLALILGSAGTVYDSDSTGF